MSFETYKIVTIIAEPVLLTQIVELIRSLGASGFTITDVRGEGSGEKHSGEVPGEKTKIEVIADAALATKLMREIASQYFANYSVIVYAMDIEVVRQDKF